MFEWLKIHKKRLFYVWNFTFDKLFFYEVKNSLKAVYKDNRKQFIISLISIFVIVIIIIGESIHAEPYTTNFYSNSCSGGWDHPELASGMPDIKFGNTGFNKSNSAFLFNKTSDINCSNFSGDIPNDATPKKFTLKLSMLVADRPLPEGTFVPLDNLPDIVNQLPPALNTDIPLPTISVGSNEQSVSSNSSTDNNVLTPNINIAPSGDAITTEPNLNTNQSSVSDSTNTPQTSTDNTAPNNSSPPTQEPVAPTAPADPVTSFFKIIKNTQLAAVGDLINPPDTISTPDTTVNNTTDVPNTIEPVVPPPDTTTPTTDTSGIIIPPNALDGILSVPQTKTTTNLLEAFYSTDGVNWKSLGMVTSDNWKNANFEITDTSLEKWSDVSNIQISLHTVSSIDNQPAIYLDNAYLEVSYEGITKIDKPPTIIIKDTSNISVISGDSNFSLASNPVFNVVDPQLTTKQIVELVKDGKVRVTDDPQGLLGSPMKGLQSSTSDNSNSQDKFIAPTLNDLSAPVSVNKNIFKKFISLFETKKVLADSPTIVTQVLDSYGNVTDIPALVTMVNINGQDQQRIEIQKPSHAFHPGVFTLQVTLTTAQAIIISQQNFSWGVLAMNTDKSIYNPGDNSYLQFAVLNDQGHTICNADLELSISSPSGIIKNYTTNTVLPDGYSAIVEENKCGPDNVISVPDYYTHYTIPNEAGNYVMTLTATTSNGVKIVHDSFQVENSVPFVVTRTGPTRIFPGSKYPMSMDIVSKNDWSGTVTETVPANFIITPPLNSVSYDITNIDGDTQTITWNLTLSANTKQTIGYYFKAPMVSPEFYLVGPLVFGSTLYPIFSEAREWQIASDGVPKYWVTGGTGNWSSTTNWSLTDGGVPGAAVPGPTDSCDFSNLSGAGTVTVDTAATCANIDFTVGTGFTGTFAGSSTLAISGNMTLNGAMTRTYTGAITFNSTASQTIKSNGIALSSTVNFSGAGGTWQLSDNFSVGTNGITLTNGTFNTNGKTVTASSLIYGNNANTKVLTLGTSAINLSQGNSACFTIQGSNNTFNSNTSTITCSGASTNIAGAGSTFYNASFTGGGSMSISGANTFNNLTVTGTASKTGTIFISGNQTVNGTLNVTGNSTINRVLVFSDTSGTSRTITAAAVSLSNADFLDITGAGGAAPFTGSSIGSCGNVSSVTGTGAVTRYWVKGTAPNSTGNWSDTTHWATSSGAGTGGASMPLCQDTARIDIGSIDAGSRVITADEPRMGIVDFTGVTNTPQFSISSVSVSFFGNVTFISGAMTTGSNSGIVITLAPRGGNTLTFSSGGINVGDSLDIDAPSSTVSLGDNYTMGAVGNNFSITRGTFNANNKSVTVGTFSSSNSDTRTITMGSGVWSVTSTGSSVWSVSSIGLTLNGNTSTIKFTNTGSGGKTFAGGGVTYNNIWFAGGTGTGTYTITGSNTFNDFKDNGTIAHSILFTHGTTQTVSTFHVTGNSGQLITLDSDTTATFALTLSGDYIVSSDYLSIAHSSASPTTLHWYAGTHSTNGGTNTGWIFSAPTMCVAVVTGNWNTGSNWSGCTGAGGIPATADDVYIDDGVVITQDVATPNPMNSLTILAGATLDSSLSNYAISTKTLTINAASTPQPAGILTAHASVITLTGIGTSTLFTNNGTYNEGTSVITVTSASGTPQLFSTTMSSIFAITINAGATVVNAGANFTFDSAISGNQLYVQAGVFNVEGRTVTPGSAATLKVDNVATFCLGGTTLTTTATCDSGATQTSAIAMPAFTTFTLASNSNVIYLSDANTSISSTPTYGNLKFSPKLSSSKIYTLGSTMTLNGNFDSNPNGGGLARSLTTNLASGGLNVSAGTVTVEGSSSGVSTLDTTIGNYELDAFTVTIATGCTLNINGSTLHLFGTSGTLLTRGAGTFSAGASSTTLVTPNASITVTDNSTWTFGNLTFDPKMSANTTYSWGTGVITINGNWNIIPEQASGTPTFTSKLSAAITVAATGTTKIQPNVSVVGANLDTSSSDWALTTGFLDIESAGTFTSNRSLVTLNGTSGTLFTNNGTLTTVGSTSEWDITSASGHPTFLGGLVVNPTFHILKINSASTIINAGGDFKTDNNLGNQFYIRTGVFNLENHVITPGTASTLQIDSGQTFCLGGTTASTTATCDSGATQTVASTFPSFTTNTLAAGSVVVYLANTNQIIPSSISLSYGNLSITPVLTADRSYTFLSSVTINGNSFKINPSGSANTLTVGLGGNLNATTATVLIEKQGSVIHARLDTVLSPYAISTGFIDIESGGELKGNGSNLTINTSSGTGFTLNGTGSFIYDTSDVKYVGNGDVTLTSGVINFYKLDLIPAVTTTHTYTFGSGAIVCHSTFDIRPTSTGNLNVNLGAGGLTVLSGATSKIENGGAGSTLLDTTASNYSFSTGLLDIEANSTLNIHNSDFYVTGTSGVLLTNNSGTFTLGGTSITHINGDGTPTAVTDSHPWTFDNLYFDTVLNFSENYLFGGGNIIVNNNMKIIPTAPSFGGLNLTVTMGAKITIVNTLTIFPDATNAPGGILDTSGSNFDLYNGYLDIEANGNLELHDSHYYVTGTSGTLLTNNGGLFSIGGSSITEIYGNASVALTDGNPWTFDALTLDPILSGGAKTYTFGSGVITVNNNFNITPSASTTSQKLFIMLGAEIDVSSNYSTIIQPNLTNAPTADLDTDATNNYNFSTGILDLELHGTFKANASNIYMTDTADGNPVVVSAGTFNTGTSTVTYNGDNPFGNTTINNTPSYYGLVVSNSTENYELQGTTVASSRLAIDSGTLDTTGSNYNMNVGDISIGGSGVFVANNSTITATGGWWNKGTFTADTSTVLFNGGNTISIGGTVDTYFYNMTITHTTDKEADFSNTSPIIGVTNLFTVTGHSGHPMVLRSDSIGTQWQLLPTGTANANYVDVQDGGCQPGYINIYPTQFVNSGNNDTCWTGPLITFSISDHTIGFGNLSSSTTRYATGDTLGTTTSSIIANTLNVATNALGGYVVTYIGQTLQSGSHSISTGTDLATGGTTGTSQFAMCANVTGQGTADTHYDYLTPKWTFIDDNNYHTIVSSSTSTSTTSDAIDMRYEANISSVTTSGNYGTTITFLATGTF